MQKIKLSIFITMLALFLGACSSRDDSPNPGNTSGAVTANDFTASIDENPTEGTVIGTVSASTSDGSTLTYSLSNENVAGALAIDASTGELTVSDVSAFDFETNPSITATYKASNGTDEVTASISITINDIGERPFITTWETTNDNEGVNILTDVDPFNENPNTGYNYTVDWGDGTVDENVKGDAGHIYAQAGMHQVKITGTFPAINHFNPPVSQMNTQILVDTRNQLQSIDQWGDIVWGKMFGAFTECVNLTIEATDSPNLSNVNSLQSMFSGTSSLTGDLSNWNLSTITDMGRMFQTSSFNEDISSWDVSNVTNMRFMFFNASTFNQNLSGWSVANVTSCQDFALNSPLTSGNSPNFTNCTP